MSKMGWECPKCSTVYSPHVDKCVCSRIPQYDTPKTETVSEEVPVISTLDEITEEEILMWHSPYYDELQAQKTLRKEQIELGDELNGND